MMSEPSQPWISIAVSGVSRWLEPSMWDWKRSALVVDPGEPGEREDLEPAAVGQDGAVPVHEPVQPAKGLDHLAPGPQVEVVGVAQDDLGAGGRKLLGRHRLDRAERADRHEDRGLDRPVGGFENAGPRAAAGALVRDLEFEHGSTPYSDAFFT